MSKAQDWESGDQSIDSFLHCEPVILTKAHSWLRVLSWMAQMPSLPLSLDTGVCSRAWPWQREGAAGIHRLDTTYTEGWNAAPWPPPESSGLPRLKPGPEQLKIRALVFIHGPVINFLHELGEITHNPIL